jgi:hypothetical protein
MFALGCNASSNYMGPAGPLTRPRSGEAQIVFVRDSALGSAVVLTIVDEKGNFVGESTAHSHFAVTVPPGKYTFIAWGEGTHAMRANVAPGKRYYVEVSPDMGVWSARFHLLAAKPNTEKWRSVHESMAGTEPTAPLQAQGQAYVSGRAADRADAIRKGLARLAGYTPAELAERTLEESDGE